MNDSVMPDKQLGLYDVVIDKLLLTYEDWLEGLAKHHNVIVREIEQAIEWIIYLRFRKVINVYRGTVAYTSDDEWERLGDLKFGLYRDWAETKLNGYYTMFEKNVAYEDRYAIELSDDVEHFKGNGVTEIELED